MNTEKKAKAIKLLRDESSISAFAKEARAKMIAVAACSHQEMGLTHEQRGDLFLAALRAADASLLAQTLQGLLVRLEKHLTDNAFAVIGLALADMIDESVRADKLRDTLVLMCKWSEDKDATSV